MNSTGAGASDSILVGDRGVRGTTSAWRSHPSIRDHFPAFLTLLIGAVLSGLVFVVYQVQLEDRQRAEFERHAEQVTTEIQIRLELPTEVLRSISGFFHASSGVSRAEFRSFVSGSLSRYPTIRALEWIPIVPGSERTVYEARAHADGLVDFSFKEEIGGFALGVAKTRAEHFPIFYMEPPDENALGFDIAADAERRAPADRARQRRAPAASHRIRLVEDPPSVHAVAVFQPIESQGQVVGFATGVLGVHSIFEPVLTDAARQNLGVLLEDPIAPPALRLLFESSPRLRDSVTPGGPGTYTTQLRFTDRTWSMTFVDTGTEPSASPHWAVLASGLGMSALAGLVVSASILIRRLRRQVHAALQLGQYTLVEKLGEGGMGTVYRAQHAMLRRPTAIKVLSATHRNSQDVERFEREVQLTSRLSHPNTIAVYDYGRTPDGLFYYAMEFIEGLTLQDLVSSEGAIPASRAVRILEQVCSALAEAHAAGIVHRDIKPANLMITDRGGIPDFVKVLDFGLVKETSPEAPQRTTLGNPLLGTPLYISPEAILTGVVDPRADIYGLGGVAYFLVTGSTPFDGANVVDVCAQHVYSTPRPPSSRTRAFVPPVLESLILRCLAKAPEARPQSARAVLRELREIADQIGPYTEEEARSWWQERGNALIVELCTRRHSRRALEPLIHPSVPVELRRAVAGGMLLASSLVGVAHDCT